MTETTEHGLREEIAMRRQAVKPAPEPAPSPGAQGSGVGAVSTAASNLRNRHPNRRGPFLISDAELDASLSPAPTSGSEAGGEGKLVKRPVAYRICAPQVTGFQTLYYATEDAAREASEKIGVDYEGLYVRDGTPLNFAKPAPAAGDVREALRLAEGRIELLLREFPDESATSDHPVATKYVLARVKSAIAALSAPAPASAPRSGVAIKVGDTAYAKVRVDTAPKDGWAFVTPSAHPEDVINGYQVGPWDEGAQFFGEVYASPSPAQGETR